MAHKRSTEPLASRTRAAGAVPRQQLRPELLGGRSRVRTWVAPFPVGTPPSTAGGADAFQGGSRSIWLGWFGSKTRKILLVSSFVYRLEAGTREQTPTTASYPGVTEGSRP